jgi:hypothetical protein
VFLEDQLDGHTMVLPCRRLPDDGAKAWAIVEERGSGAVVESANSGRVAGLPAPSSGCPARRAKS